MDPTPRKRFGKKREGPTGPSDSRGASGPSGPSDRGSLGGASGPSDHGSLGGASDHNPPFTKLQSEIPLREEDPKGFTGAVETSLSPNSEESPPTLKKKFGNTGKKVHNIVKRLEEPDPEIPTFTGVYLDDYDILNVHEKILGHFEDQKKVLPAKRKQLSRLVWIMDKAPTLVERSNAEMKVRGLQKEIERIESESALNTYTEATSELLDEYKELSKSGEPRRFGSKKEQKHEDHDKIERRVIVVSRYLHVARSYASISLHRQIEQLNTCPKCKTELGPDNSTSCPNPDCAVTFRTVEHGLVTKEQTTGTQSKSNYEKGNHIKDATLKLEGLQNVNFPANLVPDLQSVIKMYRLDIKTLSIETLQSLLKTRGFSEYYEDIHLIWHLVTGNPLPDLSEIREKINDKADKIIEVYQDVKPENRTNYINAQFTLFKILEQEEDERYHIPKKFFIFSSNRDVLKQYHEIWSATCKRWGWSPIIPTV